MAQPRKLLIWQKYPGRPGREEALLAGYAKEIGVPVETASEKQMERSKVDVSPDYLVAGTVPFMRHALRRLGAQLPDHVPYPAILTPWLGRKVWREQSLGNVLGRLQNGRSPLFVKPADGWKRFTGFVVEFADDYRLQGVSKRMPVWVSEPIDIVSEWRAYVLHGDVRAIEFADHGGDPAVWPDHGRIVEAVTALATAKAAPAGFVIDFGVTRDGRTVLIEMNDGFSFGAYGKVDAKTYWDITWARWQQLAGTPTRESI